MADEKVSEHKLMYRGIQEEDEKERRQAEKEQLAALRRAHKMTTEPAKKAELANRLAMMGHDPNDDSKLGNPVPDRQSPPKATADAAPDMDVNKAAGEARGLKMMEASEPRPIGVDSDKLPGDQEMFNHDTGERTTDVTPGTQAHFNHLKDEDDSHEDASASEDEAKNDSASAKQDKAEKASGDSVDKPKPSDKPAAKPVPETSDAKKRDADKQEDKSVKPEAKPVGKDDNKQVGKAADKPETKPADKEVKHVIVDKDKDK